ncbi:hypothetical protein TruAng_004800 [Truncatella angustata]|nr:hypothetical protein TruAng_004800 [Truncatella angustata]
MRGQISQGLLEPLDMFPEIGSVLKELEDKHGKDAVERLVRDMSFEDGLKVVKWEPMDSTSGRGNGNALNTTVPFPAFLNRTDQERAQNLPRMFDEWTNEMFQETTKMDGSSMTVYFLRKDSDKTQLLPELGTSPEQTTTLPGGRFGVCSRHVDLGEHDANGRRFWEVAKRNNFATKLSELNRNIALQGELCGDSIQRNFESFPKNFHDFFLFSVWDIDEQKYLKPKEAEVMATKLGVRHVPVHGYFYLRDIATSVDELLSRAEGKGLRGKKREGIVLKHSDGGISFKVISNSYLLKHGE